MASHLNWVVTSFPVKEEPGIGHAVLSSDAARLCRFIFPRLRVRIGQKRVDLAAGAHQALTRAFRSERPGLTLPRDGPSSFMIFVPLWSMRLQIPEIFRGVHVQEHPPLRVKGAENLGRDLEELLARIELLDLQAVPIEEASDHRERPAGIDGVERL
jgi:hypothetical protein